MAGHGSLQTLRSANTTAVLDTIASRGGASRAEIARLTGLARTTVSTVVGDLLAQGTLVEHERRRPGAAGGRPAGVVSVNPAAGLALGVHLAHDHADVVLSDLAGGVVDRRRLDLDVDGHPDETLLGVGRAWDTLVVRTGLAARVVGAGVAVSAPVRLRPSSGPDADHLLPRWRGVDVAADLRRRLGVPVSVDNDANVGALAEWTWGAGAGCDDLVYVMLADGVGAGLVLDGRIYRGGAGGAGEIGHVVVVPDGRVCRCGNRGCLETVAGSEALCRALGHDDGTALADVVARAEAGDPGAVRVVADAGRATARALAPLCTVLDPRRIVLGGTVAAAGAVLVDAVVDELGRRLPASTRIDVSTGGLGVDAEVRGAVALALGRVDRRRILLRP